MKFLVDAQLPRRLIHRLLEKGHDAIHTSDLAHKNRTPDPDIEALSLKEKRILITKDSDFVDTFVLFHRPYKLLLISTGNINNNDLERIFLRNIKKIVAAFKKNNFIELNRTTIIIHQ